jgi:hypothetical protein
MDERHNSRNGIALLTCRFVSPVARVGWPFAVSLAAVCLTVLPGMTGGEPKAGPLPHAKDDETAGAFVIVERPGDYDACWDPVGVDPALLDPILLNFHNERLLQKIVFFGELFPSHWPANAAGQRFLEFFQTDKDTGSQKGIVLLTVQELP